jgi:hypothetical protein
MRIFKNKEILLSTRWKTSLRSSLSGRNWRISRLMFSLLKRCQGLRGAAKCRSLLPKWIICTIIFFPFLFSFENFSKYPPYPTHHSCKSLTIMSKSKADTRHPRQCKVDLINLKLFSDLMMKPRTSKLE